MTVPSPPTIRPRAVFPALEVLQRQDREKGLLTEGRTGEGQPDGPPRLLRALSCFIHSAESDMSAILGRRRQVSLVL